MAKAIHSMVRVLDEARSLDFYQRAFELEIAARLDFDTFTLIYLSNAESGFELELTVNKGTSEPYDLGNGYGHMAFSVDDIEAEHSRFSGLGFEPTPIRPLAKDGKELARFFFVSDPDGYKIEVIQRGGRYL
ncbi:lactoylglutathione lyase [Faunimonas pinastri]|uniref:Lactoylglutathione lyase n=1 Tax=Faunimonas pinastri TaxID=1855383 RepID=A0A1H9MCM3_9HYPH|nr:VOC family protein [Faunimonas pinastri]SER21197.1 lactoylglutathione lyase [Faunimonas pinastri]